MVQCPSCGGALRFDIAGQCMQCDHCGNAYDPAALNDNVRDDAKTQKTYEGFVYTCPSCGGELMTTDQNDAVGFCPFCGGASMIFDKMRQEWKPDGVIPFNITKEQCKQAYLDEVKRHRFVSKKYRDPQLIESFRGIYMPYWTYVAEQKGEYTLEAKSKERYVGSSTYETDVYNVTGRMDMTVEGYTHDASAAFDDSLSEKIAPFDERARRPFAPGYLSGFYAEVADVSEEAFRRDAKKELEQFAIDALNQDPGVSQELQKNELTVNPGHTSIPIKITAAKRVLRPVWFMSYRNKDKITYAVVNGQTGKVCADLPLSPARILIAALLASAALFLLLVLGMHVLPSIKGTPTLGIGILLLLSGLYFTRKSFCFSMEGYHIKGAIRQEPYLPVYTGKEFVQPSDIFAIVCAVIGLLILVSDGSYAGTGRTIGNLFLIPSLIVLVVKYVKLNSNYKILKNAIKKTPGQFRVGTATDAIKLMRGDLWLRIVSYVSMFCALVLIVSDSAPNGMMYSVGGVLMLELFGLMLYTIRFQSNVAKRMPPQFGKKGALYDEK